MGLREYVVRDGDDGVVIAARFGYPSFDTVWDLPENADLRARRKTPFQLFPGDVVWIPERMAKTEPLAEKKRSRFRVTLPVRTARTVLVDEEGTPRKGVPYRVLVEESTIAEGETGDDGVVEATVPASVRYVVLWTAGGGEQVLHLGALNPLRSTPDFGASGTAQRLAAMGYYAGPLDGSDEELLDRAVTAWKRANGFSDPITAERDEAFFAALERRYGQ